MCSRSRESPSSRVTPGAHVTRCRRCCLGLESPGPGGSRRGSPKGTPGTGAAAACITLASSVRRLPASICFESAPSSVCIRHRQSNRDASTARKSSSRLPANRPPPPIVPVRSLARSRVCVRTSSGVMVTMTRRAASILFVQRNWRHAASSVHARQRLIRATVCTN